MSDFDNGNNSMLDVYLFEATSLLNRLDEILLASEDNGGLTPDDVNEIFRIMHTIKGSSAMMEFNTISFVSHKLEDLFFVIRDNGLAPELFEDLLDIVLRVSDFLKAEVEKVQLNQPLQEDNQELVDDILGFLAMLKGEAAPAGAGKSKPEAAAAPAKDTAPLEEAASDAGAPPEPTQSEAASGSSSDTSSSEVKYLFAKFTDGCQMENIRAFMLVNNLKPVANIIRTNPESLDGNPEASAIIVEKGFYCAFVSDKSDEEVLNTAKHSPCVASASLTENLGNGITVSVGSSSAAGTSDAPAADASSEKAPEPNADVKEEKSDAKATEAPAKAESTQQSAPEASKAPAPAANKPAGGGQVHQQNLISVDLSKLDLLMDLVGEIVISESMVSGNSDLEGLKLENFEKASRQLRKLTTELQDVAMSIRMVPISGTFQKMKRIVRDMSKKLDKDVELVLLGETTEVDKTIIDAIADPIMHIVRNSMDHGLETKEERAETTKDPKAKIILSAQNVGGDIIIAESDDGRGLNPEKLLQKAKDKGLLTKPESELTEKDIFNFLMAPGFSTKEQVTEFSGRGVGMDVVKKNIEKVGGSVSIESVLGHGMTVYFKIPLTLAIIESMEIRVGKNIYTLPISNIRESFKARADQVFTDPQGNEMIMIRGACYPIIRLNHIFNVPDSVENLEDGILLLVDTGERLACLLADELIGKHQVVVKPMPPYLGTFTKDNFGISGCTIMGDGSISLILDIQSILTAY